MFASERSFRVSVESFDALSPMDVVKSVASDVELSSISIVEESDPPGSNGLELSTMDSSSKSKLRLKAKPSSSTLTIGSPGDGSFVLGSYRDVISAFKSASEVDCSVSCAVVAVSSDAFSSTVV